MATEKISITMDPEIVRQAKSAATHAGVSLSAWLTRAARQAAFREGIDHDLAILASLGHGDDPGDEIAIETEMYGNGAAA